MGKAVAVNRKYMRFARKKEMITTPVDGGKQ
jgi:hypothetical protein